MDERKSYIFGRNSILEALRSDSVTLEKIFVSFSAKGDAINKIFSAAKRKKINCVKYDNRKFIQLEKSITDKNSNTQGVIALIKLYNDISLDELIARAFANNKNPLLIALDSINDPHNLGAIARTAECAGVSGIILSERDSSPVTPTAIKISSGALEHIPVFKGNSFPQIFAELKENGFWIVGTDMEADINYFDYEFKTPTVIVIGNEGKGLKPSTKKHCDKLLKIPVLGKIDSLNASVSAGIILYEALRQNMK